MVNVDGRGKMKKMTPIYLIVSLIIFIIHMIMSIIGKIHIFHVIISPMLFTVTISVVQRRENRKRNSDKKI